MERRKLHWKPNGSIMRICFMFVLGLTCTACTINIIMTHTQGYANDVVDDTTSEQVEPQLSVPVKGI